MRWERGRTQARDFKLDWGTLSVRSGSVDGSIPGDFRAAGGIVLRREDEEIRGDNLFVNAKDGTFQIDRAESVLLPFRLSAAQLERSTQGVRFTSLRLDQALPGRSELALAARAGRLDAQSGRLTLQGATLSVLGARIATIPRLTFAVGTGARGSGGRMEMPVSFRQSRTSGFATGLRLPVPLGANTAALAVWESTTTRGEQWAFDAERALYRGAGGRRSFFADGDAPRGASPLDRLLAPPAPSRLPVAYADILTLPDLIVPPGDPLLFRVAASAHRRREFARRGAVVLVSRLPEVRLDGHIPLGNGFADVRWSAGDYREENVLRSVTSSPRTQVVARVAAPPLPIAGPVRLQLQGSGLLHRYSENRRYDVGEARIALDAPLGNRNAIAAGVIVRKESGLTPFLFDRVEAGTEGQVRGQISIGSVITAVAVRFDLRQHRIFDREIGIGWKGRILEPRLTYRTLGSQIGFTVAVPALSL